MSEDERTESRLETAKQEARRKNETSKAESAPPAEDLVEPITTEVEMLARVEEVSPSSPLSSEWSRDEFSKPFLGGGWRRPFFRSLLCLLIPVVAGAIVAWWMVKDLPQEQLLDRGGTVLSSGVAARNVADALGARIDVLRTLASQGAVVGEVVAKNDRYQGSDEVVRGIVQGVDAEWRSSYSRGLAPPRPVAENEGSQALRSFAAMFPGFVSVIATDSFGAATATTKVTPQFDYSGSSWFENVMSSGQVELATVFDETNRPLLRVALPMFAVTSRPAGIVQALLDPEAVLASALSDLVAEGFKVMVIGRQGELVFRTGIGEGSTPIDASLLETTMTEIAAATAKRVQLADGREVFASGAKVPRIANAAAGSELGWRVIVVRDAEALSGLVAEQDRQRKRLFLTVAVVSVTLAALLAVWLSLPFRRLAELPRIVGAGMWNRRMSADGIAREVIASINDLLERAERAEEELAVHQTVLEDVGRLTKQAQRFAEGDHLTVFSAKHSRFELLVEALGNLRDELGSRLVTIEDTVAEVVSCNERCQDELAWTQEDEPGLVHTRKLKTSAGSIAAEVDDLARQLDEMVTGFNQEVSDLKDRAQARSGEARREVRSARARQRESETALDRTGERVEEIRESVVRLRELSDRTSVLALNGSIQAALGGQAGRGFAVIASEVEQLSKHATELAGMTLGMLKSLDSEALVVQQQLADLAGSLTEAESRFEDAEQAVRSLGESSVELSETMGEAAVRARRASQGSTSLALGLEKQDEALAAWKERVGEYGGRRKRVAEELTSLLALVRRMLSRERVSGLSLVRNSGDLTSKEKSDSRSVGNDA